MFQERPLTPGLGRARKPVAGVGINDAWYSTGYLDEHGKKLTCPFYATWAGMLERVFSPAFHQRQPTYKGCTVEDAWKTFSVFRAWMEQQPWKGNALDKDLLVQGNKHYEPATCLFVPPAVNAVLSLRGNARGLLPLGVTKSTSNGYSYFVAKCSFNGKQKTLGSFKTPEEAADCYRKAKLAHIRELAAQQTDPRVRQALNNLTLP